MKSFHIKAIIAGISILIFPVFLNAQSPLTWSIPSVVNSNLGYFWSRVSIANGNPIVVWGDSNTGSILSRKFNNGFFFSEQVLTPVGVEATVFNLTGADVMSHGDTVYVAYSNLSSTHIYLQKSLDGGITFGDTIRVDNIGNNFCEYPTVEILPGGNPIISFALLDSNFTNPQYVTTKSSDAGNSFAPIVQVTNPLGSDPCDCCPGDIFFKKDTAIVVFRNANNNIRDIRAAISFNNAVSYSQLALIDTNNWLILNCPSSGGQCTMVGDTLVSVFMNGMGGKKCYFSTYDIRSNQILSEKLLFPFASTGNQNNARIISSGDTIGVVWEQIINGNAAIMFTYSLTGPSGLGLFVDTLTSSLPNGFLTNPDIAYTNGKFYVVFADAILHKVYMMEGLVYVQTAVETLTTQHELGFEILSVENDQMTIQFEKIPGTNLNFSVFNLEGQLVDFENFFANSEIEKINLKNHLNDGLYLIQLSGDGVFYEAKKIALNQK